MFEQKRSDKPDDGGCVGGDFIAVPKGVPALAKKTTELPRDRLRDEAPAWVVRDGKYISARSPGDAHTFAAMFDRVLAEAKSARSDPQPRS